MKPIAKVETVKNLIKFSGCTLNTLMISCQFLSNSVYCWLCVWIFTVFQYILHILFSPEIYDNYKMYWDGMALGSTLPQILKIQLNCNSIAIQY